MSAIISQCGKYRYRLDRSVRDILEPGAGLTFAFFGVNPSTADADLEDQTTMKWRGFTLRNGGSKYIAGNPFAYRATDVKQLALTSDPIGPENDFYLEHIIKEADVLVPCWGNSSKVSSHLQYEFVRLKNLLIESGKPVRIFGLTKSGDPKHPLMLGYDTQLRDWT